MPVLFHITFVCKAHIYSKPKESFHFFQRYINPCTVVIVRTGSIRSKLSPTIYVSIINKFLEKHTKEHVNIFLRFRFGRDTIPRTACNTRKAKRIRCLDNREFGVPRQNIQRWIKNQIRSGKLL